MADKTKPETTPAPTDLGTARKRKAFTKKRGPRVFVKYEVVDGSGNVIPGAVARLLRVERDQTKILEMTKDERGDALLSLMDDVETFLREWERMDVELSHRLSQLLREWEEEETRRR
jgi:hypothetical protein